MSQIQDRYRLCFYLIMGFLTFLGWHSFSAAATLDKDVASFSMYSYSPIPVKVYGSANLPEGEVKLLALPSHIKQALLSPKTTNPFKTAYKNVYTPVSIKQLQKCPFIGMSYDLDGISSTKEWIIVTVFYGCMKQYSNYVSSQPHNWILQQDAKNSFRVLMESDGRSLLAIKEQSKQKNYGRLYTDHFVVNFAPNAQPQCGMAYVKWQYRQDRYHITEQGIRADNCDSLFEFGGNFEILPQKTRNDNMKKAQKAVEAVVTPWLKQLRTLK